MGLTSMEIRSLYLNPSKSPVCLLAYILLQFAFHTALHTVAYIWWEIGGGDDDPACNPKFKSIIHIIGHDKTSDAVEDNLYLDKNNDYVIK